MASTLPKPGDLIEVFRGSYQHWAIYTGDDYVVHLAPPSEIAGAGLASSMSLTADRAMVKKEHLWVVVGRDQWKVNNILDDKYVPRSVWTIVQEALRRVGDVVPYSVFSSNCEHFVTNLRYGKAESRQVQKAGETAMIAGIAGAAIFGILAWAGAFSGEKNKEKKNTY